MTALRVCTTLVICNTMNGSMNSPFAEPRNGSSLVTLQDFVLESLKFHEN